MGVVRGIALDYEGAYRGVVIVDAKVVCIEADGHIRTGKQTLIRKTGEEDWQLFRDGGWLLGISPEADNLSQSAKTQTLTWEVFVLTEDGRELGPYRILSYQANARTVVKELKEVLSQYPQFRGVYVSRIEGHVGASDVWR